MTAPTTYSFTRYLAAKKSIDDRALNPHVWATLAAALRELPLGGPPRVLEVGAGIGTMVERLVERRLFDHIATARPLQVYLTAIDAREENIAAARHRLGRWAAARGAGLEQAGDRIVLRQPDLTLTIDLVAADLHGFTAELGGGARWDLLIAQAVLDLLDVPSVLPSLLDLLAPGGLFYFTLNFDGGTIFEPGTDEDLDATVEALYHRTMDERVIDGRRSGDSRTGRRLFHHLRTAGAEVLAMGASDWVVIPDDSGYPADEAYMLHFILETMRIALEGHRNLDGQRLSAWIRERHAQVERGELVYIAHQLDVCGRVR